MPDHTIIGYQNKSGIVASCPQPGDLWKTTSATRRCSRRVAVRARAINLLLHHTCPNGGRSAATPNAVPAATGWIGAPHSTPTASKGTTMAIEGQSQIRQDFRSGANRRKAWPRSETSPRRDPPPKSPTFPATAIRIASPGAGLNSRHISRPSSCSRMRFRCRCARNTCWRRENRQRRLHPDRVLSSGTRGRPAICNIRWGQAPAHAPI